MMQAFVTVVIPFAAERTDCVNDHLGALGNPASADIAAALEDSEFVHFMSMTVAQKKGETTTHFVLEASADGSARAACARLATTIRAPIVKVLQAAGLTVPQNLGAYLEKHRLDIGAGWFSTSGAVFGGTPGMSVRRIKEEERFASCIGGWLEHNRDSEPALQKLERARNEVLAIADLKWAFVAEPVPLLGKMPPVSAAVRSMLASLCVVLLWPLLVPPLLTAVVFKWIFHRSCFEAIRDAFSAVGVEILLAGIGSWMVYRWLRRRERADAPRDEEPNAADAAQIMAGENFLLQNHLGGASILKPGFVGRLILRFVFWAVGALSTYASQPGFLTGVGTIHFARWVIVPRTDKLLFLSNYDGSWESYLEDFIARAHAGLTAIWSNTRDFPKTKNLVQGGASDGERFKRWARRYQRPTRFWFSAYPNLKTTRIRNNAAIRHGFAGARTEEDAVRWLSYLGYPAPPAAPLEADEVPTPVFNFQDLRVPSAVHLDSDDIPTLVFGGLSPLRHAHCVLVELAGPPDQCRAWLREMATDLSFGEGVPPVSAMVAAFSASGLRKLGLEEPALATFPTAFQHGMAASWRARALGDTGANAPDKWLWGCPGKECDAIVVVYADEAETLRINVERRIEQVLRFGHRDMHRIAMAALPPKGEVIREPFGFVDGISQPIIRGTRQWEGERTQIHVLEPGEFIIGYRDNLGYFPPVPCSDGFNGSNSTFLVVRQLEQDQNRFFRYLDKAAAVIVKDPRSPSDDPLWVREWIAAKMVGRWRWDGTSLVRHSTPPGTPGRTTVPQDNDFLFGAEDPNGLNCPFGAHIRRANPRDSFAPGSPVQIGITNRHRILRVGRKYPGGGDGSGNPGLLFMCLNTDIEGQFEFLQQTWVLGRDFHGLQNDGDPIVAQHREACERTMSIPTHLGPMHLPHMKDFVTVRGGGYFFMPGKRAVDFLKRS